MTQQTTDRETSWTIIEGAANGSVEARERFVELYTPALEAYLRKRWQQSTYIGSVDDAVQEVFLECFREHGVLAKADPLRPGGFRRFLLGVVHWYLDGALSAEPGARAARKTHVLRPHDYDRDALRVYRGLDYGDLLGLWD